MHVAGRSPVWQTVRREMFYNSAKQVGEVKDN